MHHVGARGTLEWTEIEIAAASPLFRRSFPFLLFCCPAHPFYKYTHSAPNPSSQRVVVGKGTRRFIGRFRDRAQRVGGGDEGVVAPVRVVSF